MKTKILVMTTMLSSVCAFAQNSSADTNNTKIPEGIKYIKMLGGKLKQELQTHMQADKTGLAAVGFCTAEAQKITNEVNAKLPDYAKVRRTSLQTRNALNTPDATDIEVMKGFEAAIKDKTLTDTTIKIVDTNESTRYYKPALVEAACLKCHGENISPEIQSAIQKAYPQDKATGYTLGALRGVVVSEIKKH